jgi:hypothetical protein
MREEILKGDVQDFADRAWGDFGVFQWHKILS